jgi:hypothetical protein
VRTFPASLALARPSLRAAAAGLIGLGVVLRLAQYLHNDSLWLDESFLALNFQNRSLGRLFGQLDYNQAAPPAYLFLEKVLALGFGGTEFALRAVALVAGIVSLPLFYAAARRILRPWSAVLALALFAVLDPFVQHGAEVKQYSSDVLVAVGMLVLGLWLAPLEPLGVRKALLAAVAGAGAVWLSYPAVFVLAGVGGVLLGEALWRRNWPRIRALVPVGAAWLASFVVLSETTLRSAKHLEASFQGGGGGGGGGGGSSRSEFFLPFPPKSTGDLGWFPSAARSLVTASVGFPRWQVIGIALLGLAGVVALFRSKGGQALMLVAPLAAVLGASALEKYPFGGRFTLFYGPYVLLLVAAGGGWIVGAIAGFAPMPARPGTSAAVGLAVVAFLAVPLQSTFERAFQHRGREEIKPVLAALQHRWRDGDVLYVYYASQYALRYYIACAACDAIDRAGPASSLWSRVRFARPTAADFAPALVSNAPHVVVGLNVTDASSDALSSQIDRLRGRPRVWALFTHIEDPRGTRESRFLLGVFDERATRRAELRPSGAALLLYDLRRLPGQ